jgi:hypothetical protein
MVKFYWKKEIGARQQVRCSCFVCSMGRIHMHSIGTSAQDPDLKHRRFKESGEELSSVPALQRVIFWRDH